MSSLARADNVDTAADLPTGSAGFSSMPERRQGGFIPIGDGVEDGGFAALHTPDYDLDDAILPLGVAHRVGLVQQSLSPE